ncbi:MAG: sulfite exporter TauE/SafE family protein [Anaerolineaceae bacterium]|nr:sulfite exporter TauE/SafE family protein [Anaerolineaceae bacterium]
MDQNLADLLTFAFVGLVAQLIDGSLGMAYGVSSTTFLLSLGVPPALASASVHTAEVLTTAVSGLSHFRLGNVNSSLFKRLVIPGAIGGFIGAYTLTTVPGDTIKPFITLYLLLMGLFIIWKAFQKYRESTRMHKRIIPLALFGGIMDAIGGGGWGPIVTSTLVASGHSPRYVIGSVNAAEFFVTVVQSATFLTILGTAHWIAVLGLIIGGVPAAPFAAYLTQHISPRRLMLLVGLLIVTLSIRNMLVS